MTFSSPHLCKHFISEVSLAVQKETHGIRRDAMWRADKDRLLVSIEHDLVIETMHAHNSGRGE